MITNRYLSGKIITKAVDVERPFYNCGRTFNSLTGTPMARLRKKEKWLKYSEELRKGVSIIMAKEAGIAHQAINIKAGVRVKEKIYHIQNVNAYDSRLKRWMQRFNGVATKYLGNYLGWRRFIERRKGEAINPKSWLIEALGPALATTSNS